MPTITFRTCPDCRKQPVASIGAARCADCQQKHQQANDRYRNRRAANTFENSLPWRKCSHHIRRCNPICQAIWYGIRCNRPSTIVHHLVDPETAPHLRTDPSNLVALCANCHITSTGDAGKCSYSPTISNVAGVTYTYDHGTVEQPKPGTIAEALAWIQGR